MFYYQEVGFGLTLPVQVVSQGHQVISVGRSRVQHRTSSPRVGTVPEQDFHYLTSVALQKATFVCVNMYFLNLFVPKQQPEATNTGEDHTKNI